jgi:hypothetical protein
LRIWSLIHPRTYAKIIVEASSGNALEDFGRYENPPSPLFKGEQRASARRKKARRSFLKLAERRMYHEEFFTVFTDHFNSVFLYSNLW